MFKSQYIILVFLLCQFVTFPSFGQESKVDSLLEILKDERPLQSKHEYVLELAQKINWSDPERALSLVDTLRELDNYKSDSSLILLLRDIQAKALRGVGNYEQSISLYTDNYDYYKRNRDSVGMAKAAGQIGIMNNFNGNLDIAQGWLMEAHQLFEKVGSDAQLGLAFINDKRFEEAEENLLMQGKLDSILDTKWGLGFFHDFMGYLRQEEGKYPEAYKRYKISLAIRENLSSHYNIAESRISLGNVCIKLERFDEAIGHASSIFKDQDKSKSLSQQQSAHKILAEAYEAKGQFRSALEAQKNYHEISDSVYNKEKAEQIAEKDALFKKAEQDNQIALLRAKNEASQVVLSQQRKKIIFGGISLGLISLLSFFLWRTYQSIKKRNVIIKNTLAEKDLLLREIHHRVKNNLQFVSSLLNLQSKNIKDEKVAKAITEGKARVRSMALIHQDLYQKDNLLGVSVRSYLDKLCNELFNTYNVTGNAIELNLEIEDIDLDVETLVPLGLIINELMTNSIKYAFPENQSGKIDVALYEENKSLVLKIIDNGIGVDFEKVKESKSFGHFLVSMLSKQLKGEMDVSPNKRSNRY